MKTDFDKWMITPKDKTDHAELLRGWVDKNYQSFTQIEVFWWKRLIELVAVGERHEKDCTKD